MFTREEAEQVTDLLGALWPKFKPSNDQLAEILKRLGRQPVKIVLDAMRKHYSEHPDDSKPTWQAIYSAISAAAGCRTIEQWQAQANDLDTPSMEYQVQFLSHYEHDDTLMRERDLYATILIGRGVATERIEELKSKGRLRNDGPCLRLPQQPIPEAVG